MELLIFTNRSDALLGSKIAFTQMKRTDLNMHVGIEDVKSKAKAMFFSYKRKYSKLDNRLQ